MTEAESVTKIVKPSASTNSPFLFQDLGVDILRKIIGHVFVLEGLGEQFMWPFYRQGMLAGYIRVGKGDEAVNDNVNLQLLRVNKLFRATGSQVFYGGRTFVFDDPILCSWWTTHIGTMNFSNIRSLTVRIDSGFPPVYLDIRSAIDLTFEEEWFGFFCWLKDRHQLDAIHIELCGWLNIHVIRVKRNPSTSPAELETEEKAEILHWRRKLQGKISKLRGLQYASIADNQNSTLTPTECDELCALMTQSRDTLPKSPDRRNMPLSEVLAQVRLNNQQHGAGNIMSVQEEVEQQEEERRRSRFMLAEEGRRKRDLEATQGSGGGEQEAPR
ncbi:hypothetical protein A1O3_06298 [Capronia epimyces CBS 606.96]|uniref:Uncharacterized protein n=1 Tax=Capronia epimyces CBS 606.96 TaxID=1182542 RepID=W9XYN5_9EURO|nr:uncharacterized protein A1O3_06298 [Capronia epimyces CBS 606.96]EXJ82485.1 hypothetical protein A1O3_06298 [Capronia epimyces CBS 606.96]